MSDPHSVPQKPSFEENNRHIARLAVYCIQWDGNEEPFHEQAIQEDIEIALADGWFIYQITPLMSGKYNSLTVVLAHNQGTSNA